MKELLKIAAIASLAVAATSCGSKGPTPVEVLGAQAAEIDSIVRVPDMPVKQASASVAEDKDIRVDVALSDSSIHVDALGEQLFNYFSAQQLRGASSESITALVRALAAVDGELEVVLTDVYGNTKDFDFSSDEIKHLYTTPRTQLPVGEAKSQVAELFAACVPASALHEGATVETSIEKSFITYSVRWKNVSAYRNLSQANLVARYLEPTKAQLAKLGKLYPEVVEMMKSLGIDGIRFEYSAENSDYVIKQAFPWREL